jgi:PAS domain S-box-containing protein
MIFELSMFPMVVSLTVAALCLTFGAFQTVAVLKRPEFPWNKWGAGLSVLTAIYAAAVFFQYNLAEKPANILCERVQYTIFPLLVHALFGFTAAFLSFSGRRRHQFLLIWHAVLLGLLWSTDLIVGDTFVTRSFLWLKTPYVEPATGPLGIFYLLYVLGVALYVLVVWLKPAYRGHTGRMGFVISFLIWCLLGINDILGTIGLPVGLYLMEYGFLGFSLTVVSLSIHKYMDLYRQAKTSEKALKHAEGNLRRRVRERTAEITQSNQELKAEISDRKRVEKALRESDKTFRALIANISDVIAILDAQGIIRYESPSITRHFGWAPEELVGTHSCDLVHPNERGRIQQRMDRLLGTPGAAQTIRCRYHAKDQTYRHIELMAVNMLNKNGINGILVNFHDISDRVDSERALKASEQRLRKAQAMAHVGHWEFDPATQSIRGSEEWFRMYGLDRTTPVVPLESVRSLIVKEDRPRAKQALDALLHQNTDYDFVFRIQRGDNSQLVWLHSKAELAFRGDGHEPLVSGVVQDITASKRAEEENARLENQLRQAQKMESIGTLAGGIAHDFNNILSPIIGFTEMTVTELPESSQSRANLEEVLTAAHRAKEMVRHILTFSRQDTQEMKPMQIRPVVQESMKLLRSSLPSTIDIQVQLDEETGSVMGDSTQIHQLVVNLCTNAYQAMREGGGRLEVTLAETSVDMAKKAPCRDMLPGTYVCLSVKDTGHGIDQAIIDRIFEPYFTTKGPAEGTGMGLSMVHGIVKSHQGHIDVASTLGAGTTFRIYIPRMASVHETTFDETTECVPVGHEHILLVDDEPQLLAMQRQILERLGYAVTAMPHSKKALAMFRQAPESFDLLITDQTMPLMTGAELSVEALKARPDLPVILCTGFSEALSPEAAADIGIRHYLQKPVPLKALASTVRLALNDALDQSEAKPVSQRVVVQ